MISFPHDVSESGWNRDNLTKWQDNKISDSIGCKLSPLEAKTWHAIGLLVRTFDAAGHLLYFVRDGQLSGPEPIHYLHAYLIACSAIELLARCKGGHEDFIGGRGSLSPTTNEALKQGFKLANLVTWHADKGKHILSTNEEQYTLDKLVALRNLAAHGMGVASISGKTRLDVFLHIELLDNFPRHLSDFFDASYRDLIDPSKYDVREKLAKSGLQPVLYAERPGQAFISPIRYAYEQIVSSQKMPSDVLQYTDWQVYKG
jgi:hypothetical protein